MRLLAGGKRFRTEQVNDCCYIVNGHPPGQVVLAPGGRARQVSVPAPGIQVCPDGRFGVTALRSRSEDL